MKLSDVFSRSKASFLSTDKFRLCTVHQAVVLLHKFARLYSHLPSFAEIFKPVTHFCDKLPVDVYPSKLKVQRFLERVILTSLGLVCEAWEAPKSKKAKEALRCC